MNVAKNKTGITLSGITDKQALALIVLLGNLEGWNKNAMDFYYSLNCLYPNYHAIWKKYYNGGASTNIKFYHVKETHEKIVNETLETIGKKSIQGRDSKGRFLPKFN